MDSRRVSRRHPMKEVKQNLLLPAILLILVLLASFYMLKPKAYHYNRFLLVTIEKGDSLWTLASKYNETNKDIRDYVLDIKRENNLQSSNIHPGQELKIPLPAGENVFYSKN